MYIKNGDDISCSWQLDKSVHVPDQLHFIPDSVWEALRNECLAASSEKEFHVVVDNHCHLHNWPKGCITGHEQKHGGLSFCSSIIKVCGCRTKRPRSLYVNILLLKPLFGNSNTPAGSGVAVTDVHVQINH